MNGQVLKTFVWKSGSVRSVGVLGLRNERHRLKPTNNISFTCHVTETAASLTVHMVHAVIAIVFDALPLYAAYMYRPINRPR